MKSAKNWRRPPVYPKFIPIFFIIKTQKLMILFKKNIPPPKNKKGLMGGLRGHVYNPKVAWAELW
jgi:hypothetical protein